MRRITWRVLATLALAVAAQAVSFAATNTNAATEEGAAAQVLALREDIDTLRTQLNTGMTTSYDDPKPAAAGCNDCGGNSCGCGECCQSCCNTCCQSCGTCGCFEPCCHSCGVYAIGEAMWFKYHRADGVRVGTAGDGENAEFDFEITPRVTLGWVGSDGLGARVRYWKFDHAAEANDGSGPISVDTWTLDFEVFDTFCLNRNWDLELAAGIRYNEFDEQMVDQNEFRRNQFDGYGIVASAELRRLVGCNGAIFVRTRASILMDDKDIFNNEQGNVGADQNVRLTDVVVGQLELAFGYDYIVPYCDGSYAFARLQAEWQNWYNYSSAFVDTNDNANERFGGPTDVGFGGFGVAIGLMR